MTKAATHTLIQADARRIPLADKSVHCIVTSPPYFAVRDYGVDGQIGLEPTLDEYLAQMVAVFREVRRVLRDDGVVFLNIGDTYCNAGTRNNGTGLDGKRRGGMSDTDGSWEEASETYRDIRGGFPELGIKKKDRMGVPHRLVFALQDDGWYFRDEIIWAKSSPMPESVKDRRTKIHEFVFMLTKRPRYFYDQEAILEPSASSTIERDRYTRITNGKDGPYAVQHDHETLSNPAGRNMWSVMTLASEPFPGSHFATFPRKLIEPFIKAGTSEKGCCPKCRSPWKRIVEEGEEIDYGGAHNRSGRKRADAPGAEVSQTSVFRTGKATSYKTTGWSQSCDCPTADPVPCLVLDPFSGAGTTGVAALALGRSYIGLDLNREYLEMSERRITRPHARIASPAQTEFHPLFDSLEENNP